MNPVSKKELDMLFINAPSAFSAYSGTRVNAGGVQIYPLISHMALSAYLRRDGFSVSILDLGIELDPYKKLGETLNEVQPRFVGLTSTTPLFFEVAELSKIIRKKYGAAVKIIYGGPHATALPEESLLNSEFDAVVFSEGENTLLEIVQEKPFKDIKGIYYKDGNEIKQTERRDYIKDLDSLPYLAADLYDLSRYQCSRLIAKYSPCLSIETSRGCPYNCTFCNKNISATLFRAKSPERVVDEIEYLLKLGAKDVRIIDDQFATILPRAKAICELIIKRGLKFPWSMAGGVRVDRIDQEFLNLAKQAGCWQAGIGFESGDQKSLDSIEKGITLEQSEKAMKMIRKAGIESVGFFILGLPADTEESLKRTTNFAIKLMPDLAKVTITIPFPGTRLFTDYEKRDLIKSRDWSLYNLHKFADIYEHPNLSRETLLKYYFRFYRKFYFHPKYIFRRVIKSLKEGTFWLNVSFGLQTFLPTIFKTEFKSKS